MSSWQERLRADPIPWLLEPDNSSVRRFALTDLLDRPAADPEVRAAAAAIMDSVPVRAILDAQYPDGYWIKPGIGYSPKYKATVWQLMFLADLGASRTGQIEKACQHVFEHTQQEGGRFIANRGKGGAVICLNGNLLHSLLWVGYGDDERVEQGFGWLVERITGNQGFRCHYNNDLPCAWGAVKALLAFAALLPARRTPAATGPPGVSPRRTCPPGGGPPGSPRDRSYRRPGCSPAPPAPPAPPPPAPPTRPAA